MIQAIDDFHSATTFADMALESYMKNLIGPSNQVLIVDDNSTSTFLSNACSEKHMFPDSEEGDADTSSRHSRTHVLYRPIQDLPSTAPCTPVRSKNWHRTEGRGRTGDREDAKLDESVKRHRSICQSLSPGVFPRSSNRRPIHKSPPPRQPLTLTDEDTAGVKTKVKKQGRLAGLFF
jgi:hypothetical protein